MNNLVESLKSGWSGISRLRPGMVSAFVDLKDYGADVQLSDGRSCSLWAYAVSGSVVAAAVNWAERRGALDVQIRS